MHQMLLVFSVWFDGITPVSVITYQLCIFRFFYANIFDSYKTDVES